MLPKLVSDDRVKRLIRYNALYMVAFGVRQGISKLLINSYLARHMGESMFGAFLIVMGIANLVAFLPVGGIYQTIIREHSHYDDRWRDVFYRTGLVMVTLLALVCFIGFYSSKWWLGDIFHNPVLGNFVGFLSLYALFFAILSMERTVLRIRLQFGLLPVLDILEGTLLLSAIPLFLYLGAAGAAMGFFISVFGLSLILLYYLRHTFLKRPYFDAACAKKILRISPLFTGASMLDTSMHNIDRWLIGFFFNTTQVSYYFAAASVAAIFLVPFALLQSILYPLISQKRHISELKPNDLKRFTQFMLISVLGIIILGLMLGEPITRLLYTRDMTLNSRTAYIILLMGQSLNLLQILSRSFIDKFLNPAISIYTLLATAGINILLAWILIPRYGINGAAAASAVSAALDGCIWFYIYLTRIVYRLHPVRLRGLISETN